MSIFSVDGVGAQQKYAPVSLIFSAAMVGAGMLDPPDRVVLDAITVDAMIEEEHEATVDVTEHPVEKGADITDHIRPRLRSLRLYGIISNTPLGFPEPVAGAIQLAALATGVTVPSGLIQSAVDLMKSGGLFLRVKAAFDQLQQLVDNAVPVTLHTPLKDYTNVAICSLRIVRRSGLGDAIEFTAYLKEVRTVDSLTVTTDVPANQPSKNIGTQGTSSSSKITTPAISVLKAGTNALGITKAKFRTAQ